MFILNDGKSYLIVVNLMPIISWVLPPFLLPHYELKPIFKYNINKLQRKRGEKDKEREGERVRVREREREKINKETRE